MADTLPFKECKKHGVLGLKDLRVFNSKRTASGKISVCKKCQDARNKKWAISEKGKISKKKQYNKEREFTKKIINRSLLKVKKPSKIPIKICKTHGEIKDSQKYLRKCVKRSGIYFYVECKLCRDKNKKKWDENLKNHVLLYRKKRNRFLVDNLTQQYLDQLIKSKFRVKPDELPGEVKEVYKGLILLKRQLKEIKDGTNSRE